MGRIVLAFVLILIYRVSMKIEAKINYVDSGCDGTQFNYTEGSVYENNLDLLLSELTSKTSSLMFYNSTIGAESNRVYGLFQCRFDIQPSVCSECVKNATTVVDDCPLNGEATVWYDECMLRYSNDNIFSFLDTSYGYRRWGTANVSNYEDFEPILANELNGVIQKASSATQRFASSQTNLTLFDQLYSFAQCTPDLDSSGCNNCLRKALSSMTNCCITRVRVAIFYPSCQLRYDTTGPFLNNITSSASPPVIDPVLPPPDAPEPSLKPGIVAAIAACGSVVLLVLSVVSWICLCRKKPKTSRSDVPPEAPVSPTVLHDVTANTEAESIRRTEFVQYDFATLKTATEDFSPENKLGEGGFGIVYKGTFEHGQLAIKRLSDTSGQGTKEFMAEALLLAKLQHKNLVKLVGFCLEGEEKLLVYEFMSNASLDAFLFDPSKRSRLDWITRYKIVLGIARGLQYLHEDCPLTIIHRDLKPGNILLDKEMNPKIADFGLAKLFDGAQKFGNTTRIVGTTGYMAPEYKMTGEYSDKSDVYSFGIMLLEIVSGHNNIVFYQSSQKHKDLPIHAWRLWNDGRSFDLTDPCLYNNCSRNEVMRCIQIGLLCLQDDAMDRPTMSRVVLMLTGSVDLPLPSTPAMSFPRRGTRMPYSSGQQSDIEQYSTTTSAVMEDDIPQDLYPRPR